MTVQNEGADDSEALADFFGMGNKEIYDQLKEFSSSELDTLMQFTKLSYEEIMMYSDYMLLAEEFGLDWMEGVVRRDLLLRKSEKGWFLDKIGGILKSIASMAEGIGEGIGQVSTSIKEAFSG